jgi:hypothetical protein
MSDEAVRDSSSQTGYVFFNRQKQPGTFTVDIETTSETIGGGHHLRGPSRPVEGLSDSRGTIDPVPAHLIARELEFEFTDGRHFRFVLLDYDGSIELYSAVLPPR